MARSRPRLFLWLLLAAVGFGVPYAPVARADEEPATKSAPPPEAAPQAKKPAPPRKALLWVVDSKPRIYLFGTIHIGDPRVLEHPPVVQQALDQSGALYTEIAMDAMAQMDPEVLKSKVMLPGDQTLKKILSEKTWDRLAKKLMELGTPLPMLNKMKPYVVWFRLQLAGVKPEQMEKPALDAVLFTDSKEKDKVVGGLETIDEQLDIFNSLTIDEQVGLVESTLDALDAAEEAGVEAPIQGLIDVYLAGDLDVLMEALLAQTDNADAFTRKLMKRVLDDRNVLMADRMIEKLKANPDKTHFVAVGAAHYGGEMGILALLRKKGYTIWRATEPAHLEGPPKPTVRAGARSRRAPVRGYRRIRVGPFCWRVPCCTRR